MGLGGYDALVYSTGREANNDGAPAGAQGGVGIPVQSVMPRAFAVLLALLLASFFFVPEQQQRNWLLYLAALAAHGFAFDRAVLRRAYAGPGGWAVAALLALPTLSLAWGDSPAFEDAADLLLAAYCILAIHLGVAGLAARRPEAFESLRNALLLAANLGALLCIGHWALNYDPDAPRLTGWLGLDNPVHASILLLAATLPTWDRIAHRQLRLRWLLTCLAPFAFALLAGARMALAAYLVMVILLLRGRLRLAAAASVGAVAGLAGLAIWVGGEALGAIWLGRGLSFRPVIWAETWAAYEACNPWIGCGIASPLAIEYAPGAIADRAHSLYLAALHHQGLLGLAALMAISGWLLHCGLVKPGSAKGHPFPPSDGAARDWAWMLGYALLASATSGDHVLVRTTLFWCYFWLPVMVLAATASDAFTGKESWRASPALALRGRGGGNPRRRHRCPHPPS